MKEIKPQLTLDDTIKELIKYRDKGIKVYCIFNNIVLHSENISYDSVYKLIYGKTRKELDEEKRMESYDAFNRALKNREKCITLIPGFINRGRKVIFPEKYEEWENYVNENIGMPCIIETVLLIMEQLDKEFDIEKASKILIDRKDVIYPVLVTNLVFRFSPFGAHFYQYHNSIISTEKNFYEWQMIESVNRHNMITGKPVGKIVPELIKGFYATENQSLDDLLSILFAAQEQEIGIYAIYNDVILYSINVTTNDAYMKVYGMTREEYMANKPVVKTKRA